MKRKRSKRNEHYVFATAIIVTFIVGFSVSNLMYAKTHLNNTAIKPFNQTDFKEQPPDNKTNEALKKTATKKTAQVDTECPVKGKKNAKGEQIYHIPGGLSYNRVKPTKCFKTEEEAKADGYKKALK
jgi:hypothetical protein